jgi:AraC-like DNA-binding protein
LGEGDEPQTASIQVQVAPYFWKSWWFVLLCLVLLSALSVWYYHRRLDLWRQQEAEKLLLPIRRVLDESEAPEQLQSRIQTILDNHERLQKSYRRSVEADKQEVMRTKKSFMERATDVVEQNYTNSEFGINEFAEALGMSKSLVSKRLNAETGQSTSQFIRNYRLTIAKKLLLENWANRNITEIAYKVGFNDPKYFTRCFTRHFGTSPSSYVEEDALVDNN